MDKFLDFVMDDPFILIFGGLIAFAIGVFLFIAIVGVESDFEDSHQFVQECLQSEAYTREECIMMAGE